MDKSSVTVMAVVQLAKALAQLSSQLTAHRLLPLLCPLMTAPTLKGAQLSALAADIKGLVDKVRAADPR